MKRLLAGLTLLGVGCVYAETVSVHIDPTVSASFEAAKEHVRAAKEKAASGLAVQVQLHPDRPFAYTLAFTPEDSGTEKAPVTWTFPKPPRPVAQKVAAPRLGTNLWYHVQSQGIEVLEAGKTPDRPKRARFTVGIPDEATAAIHAVPEGHRTRLEFAVYHKWDVSRYAVTSINLATGTLTFDGPGMKPWNQWGKDSLFELTLRPDTQAPHPALRIAGTEKQPVQHLRFVGLTVHESGSNESPEGFGPMQAAATIEAAVMIDHAREIAFRHCAIYNAGGYGIWARENCRDIAFQRCEVKWPGGGGLRIGTMHRPTDELLTQRVTVEDCVFAHGGRRFPPAVGVWIGQAAHNRIAHNEIGDFFYSGLSVGWTWGYGESKAHHNELVHNHVHHIGRGVLSDMGGVYTLGKSPGTKINANVFHHIYATSYGGWGLYTDEGSSGIEMASNVVWNVKTGGFHQHYGRENQIHHNLLLGSEKWHLQATRVEEHQSFAFHHNLVLGNPPEATLLRGPWQKLNVSMDDNLFWRAGGKPFFWNGESLADWRKRGRDTRSVIADPQITWTENGRPVIPTTGPGAPWAFGNEVLRAAGPRTQTPRTPVTPLPDPRVNVPW